MLSESCDRDRILVAGSREREAYRCHGKLTVNDWNGYHRFYEVHKMHLRSCRSCLRLRRNELLSGLRKGRLPTISDIGNHHVHGTAPEY